MTVNQAITMSMRVTNQRIFALVIDADAIKIITAFFIFVKKKAKVMQNLILGLNNTFENLGATQATLQLHEPRIFYPSGHWPETVTNSHVSANLR